MAERADPSIAMSGFDPKTFSDGLKSKIFCSAIVFMKQNKSRVCKIVLRIAVCYHNYYSPTDTSTIESLSAHDL